MCACAAAAAAANVPAQRAFCVLSMFARLILQGRIAMSPCSCRLEEAVNEGMEVFVRWCPRPIMSVIGAPICMCSR